MDGLDERLAGLVGATLATPIAPLARRALARIESAEAVGADADPLAPRADENRDDRALRQLKALDAVIGGGLLLEIQLRDRSLELVREIDDRLRRDRDGREVLATVMLIDPDLGTLGEGSPPGLQGENLLSGRRREVLERSLAAWRGAVEVVASDIRGERADDRGDR